MPDNPLVSIVEMESPTLSALHNRSILHWDGHSDVCHEEGPPALLAPVFLSSFQANCQPSALRIHPYLTTDEIDLVPSRALREIVWEQEATLLTFVLDPILLVGNA
ncbi:MAG: hypothetical protein AB7P69_25355, partial [Candidatus Binatia bacterium]